MNGRKREKPYYSRHAPYSLPKRRRPLTLDADDADANSKPAASKVPTSVVVIGVPPECSVLDLKSRFEVYGPISRSRMEPDGVAYINFRSNEAAQSAVDAAIDSSFPVSLHSTPVQVMWATNPVPQQEGGVGRKEGLSSRLVRPEMPLRRHGRGNKLGSAIVNPRDERGGNEATNSSPNNNDGLNVATAVGGSSGTYRGREIVAYDDIL
ncbi:hypothetical protein SASPL_133237 [Salvia splendens]|uniref:RRM domain-containing protein n=1 Tax=Salvia splendens TaxID=180675 RepID=A0A8X8X0Y2_SALSN|nr:uncharacterized protein At1g27050 [Salvia splendens]KAG6405645.1 hypothetical protein SASPL_133237 [Salvia splendens]